MADLEEKFQTEDRSHKDNHVTHGPAREQAARIPIPIRPGDGRGNGVSDGSAREEDAWLTA